MRIRWIGATAVGAALLVACSVSAQTAASARKELTAIYARMDVLTQKRDANGLMKYYAPNFTSTTAKGVRLSGAQVHQTMTQLFKHTKNVRSVARITGLSLKGNTATCMTTQSFSCQFQDPNTKKMNKLAVTGASKDVWMKVSSGWRLLSSQSLKETVTLNGKRMKT